MSGVNKVILIGRLGKDPELRNFDNGGCIANFSVATSETYKDRTTGEKKEITDWHNVVMKDEQAKIAHKYLKKGHLVYLEGKLKTRSYEAKDGGGTRYITEVHAFAMQFLESKKDGQEYTSAPAPSAATKNQSTSIPDNTSDDLPF
jgi:single-strand DNA-binding protein